MTTVILGFQVASAGLLILFILLHAGRGGGLSDMFGGGMSGAGGSTIVERNLDRITIGTAIVFMIATVLLHFRIRPGA
ncbi:MAG: preprotein translocase subunit SecG [Acidobacteria bacterium]|nr:preprotein translocase subunit SecG [Acidobacteriota bacterium]